MRSITIQVTELVSRLRELLALAEGGAEILIQEGDTPRARLGPPPLPGQPRTPGLHPGAFQPAQDFDAPLPDEFWLGKS
jgi:antitoxin (DNA-binding transcriptional repressor) of toxin-antitoxin stability system